MKTICDECGWLYSKGATAKELINVLLKNELVPEYLQSHLSGLRSVLEAGVPTVRNKTSGHGQGAQPISVPEYLAAYVLHLTASNIVLLVEAYKAEKVGRHEKRSLIHALPTFSATLATPQSAAVIAGCDHTLEDEETQIFQPWTCNRYSFIKSPAINS